MFAGVWEELGGGRESMWCAGQMEGPGSGRGRAKAYWRSCRSGVASLCRGSKVFDMSEAWLTKRCGGTASYKVQSVADEAYVIMIGMQRA